MNETFQKTMLRLAIVIALRIPLRFVGVWLLAEGYVEAGEWETFGTGLGLIAVDVIWYALEQRSVLKKLSHKDNIISQQESRILQQLTALAQQRELTEIALDLPTGATLQDARAIQQKSQELE